MTFAGWSLTQLAPLFAAGSAAITLLYLLRMKRREVVVPFVALWERVARESESRRLWRRLRRIFSWLIQMLILALLCTAMGDPQPETWLRAPRSLAIVIDLSASMDGPTADRDRGDDRGTRLQAACRRAEAEMRALGPTDKVMVIGAGGGPNVTLPLSRATAGATHALSTLATLPLRADLEAALGLARNAMSGLDDPRILLFSDLSWSPADKAAFDACRTWPASTCELVDVGAPSPNLAITSFAARRYASDHHQLELLATVHNLSDLPARVTLAIRSNDVDLATRRIVLQPNGSTREIFSQLELADEELEAHLRVDEQDLASLGIAVDDVAYAVVPPVRPVRVVLVSDGTNLFLEAALLSLEDHVEISALPPERGHADEQVILAADVVIYDVGAGVLPAVLPAAALIVFDPHRHAESPIPIASGRTILRPRVTEMARNHPILDGVVLKDINMHRATSFRLDPGDVPLLQHLGEAIAVLREGDHPVLAFGFDSRASDLPLRTAFPVLLGNAIDYFQRRTPGFVASVSTRPWLYVGLAELGIDARSLRSIAVTRPDGTRLLAGVEQGRARVRALATGVYRFAPNLDPPKGTSGTSGTSGTNGTNGALAVNLADRQASDLRPTVDLDALSFATAAAPDAPSAVRNDPVWVALLWLAISISMLEWAAYHRRRTV